MDVEIVYFDDCPNLAVAREHLMQAFRDGNERAKELRAEGA